MTPHYEDKGLFKNASRKLKWKPNEILKLLPVPKEKHFAILLMAFLTPTLHLTRLLLISELVENLEIVYLQHSNSLTLSQY